MDDIFGDDDDAMDQFDDQFDMDNLGDEEITQEDAWIVIDRYFEEKVNSNEIWFHSLLLCRD